MYSNFNQLWLLNVTLKDIGLSLYKEGELWRTYLNRGKLLLKLTLASAQNSDKSFAFY